jgi:hypothetical protein
MISIYYIYGQTGGEAHLLFATVIVSINPPNKERSTVASLTFMTNMFKTFIHPAPRSK